jgi:hypothetical protein
MYSLSLYTINYPFATLSDILAKTFRLPVLLKSSTKSPPLMSRIYHHMTKTLSFNILQLTGIRATLEAAKNPFASSYF